jgi:micrococcal nuclease
LFFANIDPAIRSADRRRQTAHLFLSVNAVSEVGRIMQRELVIVMLVLCLSAIAGAQSDNGESEQLRAIMADGRQVILYPDGTWEFEGNRLYDVSEADIGSYTEVDFALTTQAIVIKHTDGDTFDVLIQKPPNRLKNRETIRLLGVDAPEFNRSGDPEYFAVEASEYTKNRVYNRKVYLSFDFRLRDRYDRVLAYVYLENGSCLNAELLQYGYAQLFTGEKYRFHEEFQLLEEVARENKTGLWTEKEKSVFITDIFNEGYEEHIIIKNTTDKPVDLSNWKIVDSSNTMMVIPKGAVLPSQQTLVIYSGHNGVHDPPRAYYLKDKPIWNNKGDTAYLYNAENVLLDTYKY